jgi:hypothetical protein
MAVPTAGFKVAKECEHDLSVQAAQRQHGRSRPARTAEEPQNEQEGVAIRRHRVGTEFSLAGKVFGEAAWHRAAAGLEVDPGGMKAGRKVVAQRVDLAQADPGASKRASHRAPDVVNTHRTTWWRTMTNEQGA